MYFLCVCGGDWASEKLSGRVQLEGHLPRWRVLQNFSFQPWVCYRQKFEMLISGPD